MVAMEVDTKFLRLFKPATLGGQIDRWRVCWIGGWDKMQGSFRRDGPEAKASSPGPTRPARVTAAQHAVEHRCVLVSRAPGCPSAW
jgi:hypothetical protein